MFLPKKIEEVLHFFVFLERSKTVLLLNASALEFKQAKKIVGLQSRDIPCAYGRSYISEEFLQNIYSVLEGSSQHFSTEEGELKANSE